MNRLLTIFFTFCFVAKGFAIEPEQQTICSPTECYTIVEELGEGVFGKVYSVVDSKGESYAIKSYKIMKDTEDLGWKLLGDVKREFQLGQLFDHPHIIHSIDLFQDPQNGDNYILMELVKGKTINRISKKSISEQQSLNMALQLADTLHDAYSMGYLYLDLHMGNVMLTEDQEIKVIDLAGFFSWDELMSFYKKKDEEKKSRGINLGKHRVMKVEKFLKDNPALMAKLNPPKGDLIKRDFSSKKMFWNISYFNRVTDACIDIIRKSDLSMEDKIETRIKIKTLAWEYQESVEDGVADLTIDDYFDELVSFLQE